MKMSSLPLWQEIHKIFVSTNLTDVHLVWTHKTINVNICTDVHLVWVHKTTNEHLYRCALSIHVCDHHFTLQMYCVIIITDSWIMCSVLLCISKNEDQFTLFYIPVKFHWLTWRKYVIFLLIDTSYM